MRYPNGSHVPIIVLHMLTGIAWQNSTTTGRLLRPTVDTRNVGRLRRYHPGDSKTAFYNFLHAEC
jgi:hypothetical protein